MKMQLLFILCSWFLFFSCGNTKYKVATHSIKTINPDLMSNDFVVVIPHAGCTGCIGNATYFMIDYLDQINDKVAVIFTGIGDMKLFKLQVGKAFLENPNVYIDGDNLFKKADVVTIYPQTITLENGKINELNIFSKEQIIAGSPELVAKLSIY